MVTCSVCGAAACFMRQHPDADLYRCPACTHCFSDPASIAQPDSYDEEDFEKQHGRYFAHPNTALFARILAPIPKSALVPDIGCARGHVCKMGDAVGRSYLQMITCRTHGADAMRPADRRESPDHPLSSESHPPPSSAAASAAHG